MSYDSSGNYSLPSGYKAFPATTILDTQHNTPFEDVAAALSVVVLRDGRAPMTGDLVLLGNATQALHAVPKQQLDLKADASVTARIDTFNTFLADQTIQSNDSGATGPSLILNHNSASPAINDNVGSIRIFGKSSTAIARIYATIFAFIIDPTNGTEDSGIAFGVLLNGIYHQPITAAQGLQVGAPVGGDKGVGTINAATDYYRNGVSVLPAMSTFTPQLTFGGASVGMTGTFTGKYARLGPNLYWLQIRCFLTNKGSSVGNATIVGLPFTATDFCAVPSGFYSNMITADPRGVSNANGLDLYDGSTGSTTSSITNADFNNNSDIMFSGMISI